MLATLTVVPSVVSASEAVRYRCVEWNSKHIQDKKNADTIAKTLEKTLKCEVEQASHTGHEDVKYRCKEWRTIELKTHADAHKWLDWFKEYGFETEHQH